MSKSEEGESLTSLILRAQRGKSSDLLVIYERFVPLIKKMARKMPGDARQDAEQELFIELLLAVRRFRTSEARSDTKPNRNQAHSHLRRSR